jgi:hypothetical protein
MKHWRYSIYVSGQPAPRDARSWDPGRYEAAVFEVLERILKTLVGRRLFEHIALDVSIYPRKVLAGQEGLARPENPRAAAPAGPMPDSLFHGLGTGSKGHVEFTPGEWPRGRPNLPSNRQGLALLTDESVLFHELVHTLHYTLGRRASEVLPLPYYSVEEYRAVTVSNILLSELHYPLRANVWDTAALDWDREWIGYRVGVESRSVVAPPGLTSSYSTVSVDRLKFEIRLISNYLRDVPSLTYALAGIPESVCRYNPFRAYLEGRRTEIPLSPLSWCAAWCSSL